MHTLTSHDGPDIVGPDIVPSRSDADCVITLFLTASAVTARALIHTLTHREGVLFTFLFVHETVLV